MTIEVIFLGTGTSQGVPMIGCRCDTCLSEDKRDKRLRSSILLKVNETNIVIDTTPDFRYQMLRANVRQIDAVLYTHEHKDHIGGMDDLRAFNYIMQKPIDIYCEQRVEHVLRKDFDYAFSEYRYPGVPEINIHNIDEKPLNINNIEVVPIRGKHYKLPVLGFRINSFCYLTDMNSISDSEIEKIIGVDTLVINALRHREHISHFTLSEALDVIAKVKPRIAYLTHISHQLGKYVDIVKELPENVNPAYDGLQIKITTFVE